MDRHLWTEADEHTTWRKWAGWKHNLDDAEVLPFHLRELSGDQRRPTAVTLPNRTSHLDRARGKHVAEPDDEEPSPEGVTVSVVFYERQRRRPTGLQIAVLGGLGLAVVAVGFWAVRSLMGAS